MSADPLGASEAVIEQAKTRFSLLRAIVHLLVVLASVILLVVGFSIAAGVDGEAAGRIIGTVFLPSLPLSLWWSWARQRGSREAKHFANAFLTLLFLYVGFALIGATRAGGDRSILTPEERSAPTIKKTAEGSLLCQETLGLAFPTLVSL